MLQPLSAADAIAPAMRHMRSVLFSPFRFGRTWKISMISYLSLIGHVFLPFPLVYLFALGPVTRTAGRGAAIAVVLGSLVLTALFFWLFFVGSRLQFVFFEMVVTREPLVRPLWRKYRETARPWSWWKVAIGMVASVVMAAAAIPFFRTMFLTMPQLQRGANQPPWEAIHWMIGLYAAYFGFLLVWGLFYWLMTTLGAVVVPFIAIENLKPREALRRVVSLFRAEPGAMAGYAGLRLLLGVVGYMAIAIAYEFCLLILLAAFVIVAALIGLLLHAMHVPPIVGLVLSGMGIFVFVFGVNLYLVALAMGIFFTAFEAHTVFFLAGRYPPLGQWLEQHLPAAPTSLPYPYPIVPAAPTWPPQATP